MKKNRRQTEKEQPDRSAKTQSQGGQPPGRRLWLYRLAAVLVTPMLLILGLEMGLRVFGYGVPTGYTFGDKVDGEEKILSNPYFTWRFFTPESARDLRHFSRPLKKPAGTYRVFVLGGSAAQGEPVPAYGMARMLDTMLRDQYPGVDFDVINAGITAINSHVVLPIARDCIRLEGDLFVIYLGNNEVVGPYGAGTVFSPLTPSLAMIRSAIAVKATRIGQLVSNLLRKVPGRGRGRPARWRGMAMFLNHQVRETDPGMKLVYDHFEKNLADICRVAQEARAPIVVSTVGVNLKDCAPFAALHRPGLTQQDTETWEAIVKEGEVLRERGRFREAADRFLQAERIDPKHAELHFRLGRCYWALGDYREAKDRYVRARELDTLRFRADTRINEIIRRVAGGKSEQGIHLADSLHVLEANSPGNTPGDELLYEHVHLNFRGTYLVTRAILEQVNRVLPEWVSRQASGRTTLSERECAGRLAYTGWDQLEIGRHLIKKVQKPPFSNQLYAGDRSERLKREVEALEGICSRPEDHLEVRAQYEAALAGDDTHWSLHRNHAEFQYKCLDDPREADTQLRLAIRQCPQSPLELFRLGEVLSYRGKQTEAEKYCRRALVYDPRSTPMLSRFGDMLIKHGKRRQGIQYLREAVEIDPQSAAYQSLLGTALVQSTYQELREQGAWHLEKAIAIHPDHGSAQATLAGYYAGEAKALLAAREFDRATDLLQRLAALVPPPVSERYKLAVLFAMGGDRKTAREHLSEILRIDPTHQDARKLYRELDDPGFGR